MPLQFDTQAEYVLQRLEQYYERQTDVSVPPADDDGNSQSALREAIAAAREGARLSIEHALEELAELRYDRQRSVV